MMKGEAVSITSWRLFISDQGASTMVDGEGDGKCKGSRDKEMMVSKQGKMLKRQVGGTQLGM